MQMARKFPKRTVALVSPSVGLGLSATTVLRTSFFSNVTAVAGTGVFNGYLKTGSCFDPSGDLGAQQPTLYDQWAAMYGRYKVNDTVVRIKVVGAQGAVNAICWVGCIYPTVDPTALANYAQAASQQYSQTRSGGFQTLALAAGFAPGSEPQSFNIKIKENSILGVKGADSYDSGALVTADPTALQYSVVPILLQCNQVGGSSWTLEIDMFQNVTFSQKKNVIDA